MPLARAKRQALRARAKQSHHFFDHQKEFVSEARSKNPHPKLLAMTLAMIFLGMNYKLVMFFLFYPDQFS
jgi:hypothetical protein